MKTLIMILSEVLCIGIAAKSPVVPWWYTVCLLVMIFLKLAAAGRTDIAKKFIPSFLIFISGFLLEMQVMLKFLSGNISDMLTFIAALTIGLVTGAWVVRKMNEHTFGDNKSIALITGILAVMVLISFTPLVDTGDGAIGIKSFSLQMPELLKTGLVILGCAAAERIRREKSYKRYIGVFLAAAVLIVLTILFKIKETGTSILLIYTTIAALFFYSADTKERVRNEKSKMLRAVLSPQAPMFMLSGFLFFIGSLRRMLYSYFPIRGRMGEQYIYTHFPQSNNLSLWEKLKDPAVIYDYSSRLSGDSSQTVLARAQFKEQFAVWGQFSNFEPVAYDTKVKVSLCDYAIVTLAQGLGKVTAVVIVSVFIISLTAAIIRCSTKGRIAATVLAVQAFMQISGVLLKFCFTGINIPFLSAGGSSVITSVILLMIVLTDLNKQSKKAENTAR